MASITEERLKEMEEEMNRFEEEISSVKPPMGRGGPPKMIIGSHTYHQVQAKLTNVDDVPPGPPHSFPRPPHPGQPLPGPPGPPRGAPPPPPRGLGPGQPQGDTRNDMPFRGTLPPPPPPPSSIIDPAPAPRPTNPSEIPLRPPPPPPLGAPSGPPRHFIPPQLRHRPPPPPPPSGRMPFPPQGHRPGPPPHNMMQNQMGGRGPGPGPQRGPPPMGMPPQGPHIGPSFPGGFQGQNQNVPRPQFSQPTPPPMPRKLAQVIEKPKVVYSAPPVRNVPKEEKKEVEKVKEPEPVKIAEKPEPEPEPASASQPVQVVVMPEEVAYAMSQANAGSSMDIDGESMKKDKKEKKKKFMRTAAGIQWEDNTLADWEQDDFRIFCGDLGNEVTEEVLARAFSKYPTFIKSRVVRDKRTNKTRGYGFVSFKDPNDFMRAMREMNGKYVGNRPIKLRKSAWKERQSEVVKKKEKEKKRLGFR